MSKLIGARCNDCGKVAFGAGNWSAVWRALKNMGWTADRGVHRCPACSGGYRKRLDEEARHGE